MQLETNTMFLTTTLNDIRKHHPCSAGWEMLLKTLEKTKADDEPVSFKTILESNGLDDALWCLQAVEGYDTEIREFSRWCALQVVHLWACPPIVLQYLQTGDDTIRDAAKDATWAAGGDAARAAGGDAARAAARAAAGDAARAAAWDAMGDAAWDAMGDAALAAAWDAQRIQFELMFCEQPLAVCTYEEN
jgi:hypothetical protein